MAPSSRPVSRAPRDSMDVPRGGSTKDGRMDPRTYCEEAIEELLAARASRFDGAAGRQVVVVLTYFAQHAPSERDFTSQLKLLAESAARSNRPALAAGARAVLDDWQAVLAEQESGATS